MTQAAWDQYSNVALPVAPVGPLDGGAADRPVTGIGDQLVRASQHRDGVQLDRPESSHHGGHAASRAAPAQSLGAERDPARLSDAQLVTGAGGIAAAR